MRIMPRQIPSTTFSLLLAGYLSDSDDEFLPFHNSPKRWAVEMAEDGPGVRVFTVTLTDDIKSDLFNRMVFREVARTRITCESVTVCRNPDKIKSGWLKAIIHSSMPDVVGWRQPPKNVTRSMRKRFALFPRPSNDVLHISREDVRDMLEDEKECEEPIQSHGLQRVLLEIGPPEVHFDLFATPSSISEQLRDGFDSMRVLLKEMRHARRWHTRADLEYAYHVSRVNEPMMNLYAPTRLRNSFNDMRYRLHVRINKMVDEAHRQKMLLAGGKATRGGGDE